MTLVASAATALGVSGAIRGALTPNSLDRKVSYFNWDPSRISLFAFPLKTLRKLDSGKNGTPEVLQSKEGRARAFASRSVQVDSQRARGLLSWRCFGRNLSGTLVDTCRERRDRPRRLWRHQRCSDVEFPRSQSVIFLLGSISNFTIRVSIENPKKIGFWKKMARRNSGGNVALCDRSRQVSNSTPDRFRAKYGG